MLTHRLIPWPAASRTSGPMRIGIRLITVGLFVSSAHLRPIPKRISTKGGATSTLRKHLVKKHNKIDLLLTSEGGEPVERMSSTKRNRLHQLLINAIIIDGRCFGDFRKSGFSRFLADAIPR